MISEEEFNFGFIDKQHKEIADARLNLYEGTAKEIAEQLRLNEESEEN